MANKKGYELRHIFLEKGKLRYGDGNTAIVVKL